MSSSLATTLLDLLFVAVVGGVLWRLNTRRASLTDLVGALGGAALYVYLSRFFMRTYSGFGLRHLLVAVAVGGALWFFVILNRFVRLDKLVRESWSNVSVALKRRYELIPSLVETVKVYAKHESEMIDEVIAARDRTLASTGRVRDKAVDEDRFVWRVNELLARLEAYPELRASAHFLALQHELVDTEDRIAAARRFYNANTREYNVLVGQLPSALIANLIGYRAWDFFEIEGLAARAAPRVSLDLTGRHHSGPAASTNP